MPYSTEHKPKPEEGREMTNPTPSTTEQPKEPQAATSDLPAAFSPWSRGFTYGDWPDLRDAVWEGDDDE